MADAGIAIWESKYHYEFWRPVERHPRGRCDTGRSLPGDGNPATIADPTFTPLGAPASNLTGPNFTPPFPAYPSGHAGFGGALFEILRRFYGRDDISFTFVSDEFNGVTQDRNGNVRPLLPRYFASLSDAEEENGQSRIYLGIHWGFDKTRRHRSRPPRSRLRLRPRLPAEALAGRVALHRREGGCRSAPHDRDARFRRCPRLGDRGGAARRVGRGLARRLLPARGGGRLSGAPRSA